MIRFYVYEHWRPDTCQPFYVGKGTGRRAWQLRKRNRHHASIVKKLHNSGLTVEVKIVLSNLKADEAYSQEVLRIAFWRSSGIRLANKTGGGEGMLNPSDELRARIGELSRGRVRTPEWRANIAKGAASLPKESYERRSRSLTGIVRSEQTRLKVGAAKKNPPASTRKKNSAAARNSWANPEIRAKQIAARRGSIRITDGFRNRTIRANQEIPTGWRRGLIPRSQLLSAAG